MRTQIDIDIENLIEDFLVEAYGLVVLEYRDELEDAIQYFHQNGIKDGYGVVDWLLFRKGIIENCRSIMCQVAADENLCDEMYEIVLSSFCSIFESDGTHLRDIFTGEEYNVTIADQGLVCGRLYDSRYLTEYDILEHLDGVQIIKLIQDKEDPLLAMRQIVRATDFNAEEESFVIERTFQYKQSPISALTELGLDLFADEIGNTFEIYLEDRCLGEIEVDEAKNLLVSYTNDRESATQLDQYLYNIAEFKEESIRGIEDLD